MADEIQTRFELDLSAFLTQIDKAAAGMEGFEESSEGAVKANTDLTGKVGSSARKVKELGTVAKVTGTEMKGLSKESQGLGAAFSSIGKELTAQFPLFGKLAAVAKTTGRAATLAFGPVGIAIAAITAAIGLLIKAFTGTQEGANRVAKVTAVVSAIFDRLLGVAQSLGKTIVDTFTNPQQAVKDLFEAIKTNLINRLSAIADQFKFLGEVIAGVFTLDTDRITAGVEGFGTATLQALTGVEDIVGKVTNGFNDLRAEIGKTVEGGLRIEQINVQLRQLALSRAQNEGRINRELQEQLALVQDVGKSAAERNAAGEKFKQLQKELTAFETRRLDLEIEQSNLLASRSDTLDEEKIRIAGLVSAKEQALAEELAANRRVNNALNGLNKQSADAAIAEANRVAEERRKLAEERLGIEQALNDRIDAIQRDREISELDKTDKAIFLARERAQKELEAQGALFDQLQQLYKDDDAALLDSKLLQAQATIDIETALAAQIALIRDGAREEELEKEAEAQERRLALIETAGSALANVSEGIASQQEGIAKDAAKASIEVALSALEAQFPIWSAQIVGGSLATPQSILTGGAAGIVQSAIIIALLKAALSGVRGAALSAFYDGGIVGKDGGTKFSSGRDGYIVRAHEGEFIMPTMATKKNLPYLEAMRNGTFERIMVAQQQYQSNVTVTPTVGFSDRGIVGAIGGSMSEERKQTAILQAMLLQQMRRPSKRYHA